jgi:uncharacterized coiled-coil DUF342 family protein
VKVHPFADRFPMLPKDQLNDLAASIAERGLIHPIVLDKDGMLIDGRNRLAACKIADVKPTTTIFEGNAEEYILDSNVYRKIGRLSARAMAIALVYPEMKRGGDRKSAKAKQNQINSINLKNSEKVMLTQSRAVIAEFGADSDIVTAILHNGSLNDAYESVLARKREREAQAAYLKKLQEELDSLDVDDFDEYVDVPTPSLTEINPDAAAQIAALEEQLRAKRAKAEEARRLEREAEEAERVRREGEEMVASLQNLINQIGGEPTINVGEVERRIDYVVDDPIAAVPSINVSLPGEGTLDRQQKMLMTVIRMYTSLEELRKAPVDEKMLLWNPEGFVNALRSGIKQMILQGDALVLKYHEVATRGQKPGTKLRGVK